MAADDLTITYEVPNSLGSLTGVTTTVTVSRSSVVLMSRGVQLPGAGGTFLFVPNGRLVSVTSGSDMYGAI
jgi:hypothetical protein